MLSTLYFIVVSILILLRSAILVLEKNLAIRISAFIILLFIKGSLIDLLRSGK